MLKGQNIYFKRGTRTILEDVSIEIRPGEFIGILGKNGEGKTTLLNILAGLEKVDRGEVSYGEKNLREISLKDLRNRRAVLPQSFFLNFEMNVYDFLLLSKRINGKLKEEDFEVVDDLVEKFSLRNFLSRSVLRLSGGELQRVLFAKTLLQVSPLSHSREVFLFLDEPTAALDLEVQQRMMGTLKELVRDYQVGVVAVLHDINQASRYCDKLCILADKQVALYGSPDKVVTEENVHKFFKVQGQIIYSNNFPILTF